MICQTPRRLASGAKISMRLEGDALLFVRAEGPERAHVVEPVAELDEDDADVLGHGEEHLAQVLRLHAVAPDVVA